MSEILTIASQRVGFRWDYPASDSSDTDYSPSVFYKSGGIWTLYDNPAFWGPVKPMGLDIMFRPNWLGTERLEGYVEFRLYNTPERTDGVFFKIKRTLVSEFDFLKRNVIEYNNFVLSYGEDSDRTYPWYAGTPLIVKSGGVYTEPSNLPHPLSPSVLGSEQTVVEFGVIGQAPQIRDISLLRGVYWMRLSVLQEPEIDEDKDSFAALQMVTDTEHLELITEPGFSFCNEVSKLPATYGEMRSDIPEDDLRAALDLGFAYRNTVYYDTGEIGRKTNTDVYLRHLPFSDAGTILNPTNFRHQHPTYDPYPSDERSPNSDCSELHGNWLTFGPATLDSRQTHQHATSGCPTFGEPSHTPSFDVEKTSLSVELDWTFETIFNAHGNLWSSVPNTDYLADENVELIEDDTTIVPSSELQTYIVRKPTNTVIVNDPEDKTKFYFLNFHFEDLEQTGTYVERTVNISVGGGEAPLQIVIDNLYLARTMVIYDPIREGWRSWNLVGDFLRDVEPVGYKLPKFTCGNKMPADEGEEGEQLAPYCFAGTLEGEEDLENKTVIRYPRWARANYGPGGGGYDPPQYFSANNYYKRPTTYYRPTLIEVICNTGGNICMFVDITGQFSVDDILYETSLEEMWQEFHDESEVFVDGTSWWLPPYGIGTSYYQENDRILHIQTATFEGAAAAQTTTGVSQAVLDQWNLQPVTSEFAEISPFHSYSWRESVAQEKVSMWWLITPQYEFSEAPYPNDPEPNEDGEILFQKTMLSGNLDVKNEGGDYWKNNIAGNEKLRLDGVMQFTRRRDADNFKRWGNAASVARWTQKESRHAALEQPPRSFNPGSDGDPPVEGAYEAIVGTLAGPDSSRYWAKPSEPEVSYETIRWWAETPWGSEPKSSVVDYGEEERQAPRTRLYIEPRQDDVENLSAELHRSIVSMRIRVYFSAEQSENLKSGEQVRLPMKRYEHVDEYKTDETRRENWQPTEDVVLCRSLINEQTERCFRSRLGSDSETLTVWSDVDAFEGSYMVFSLQ